MIILCFSMYGKDVFEHTNVNKIARELGNRRMHIDGDHVVVYIMWQPILGWLSVQWLTVS
jgi:hypothetical protein